MDCGSPLLLLTCALLMTSSHSEGLTFVFTDVAANTVHVYDLSTNAVTRTYRDGCKNPEGIVLALEPGVAFFANCQANSVDTLDLSTGKVATLSKHESSPRGIAVSHASTTDADNAPFLLVSLNSGNVVKLSAKDGSLLQTFTEIAEYPGQVTIAPDNAFALVANSTGNNIAWIDLTAKGGTVPLQHFISDGEFGNLQGVVLSPGGEFVFVSCYDNLTVFKLGYSSGTVLEKWDLKLMFGAQAPVTLRHIVLVATTGDLLVCGGAKSSNACIVKIAGAAADDLSTAAAVKAIADKDTAMCERVFRAAASSGNLELMAKLNDEGGDEFDLGSKHEDGTNAMDAAVRAKQWQSVDFLIANGVDGTTEETQLGTKSLTWGIDLSALTNEHAIQFATTLLAADAAVSSVFLVSQHTKKVLQCHPDGSLSCEKESVQACEAFRLRSNGGGAVAGLPLNETCFFESNIDGKTIQCADEGGRVHCINTNQGGGRQMRIKRRDDGNYIITSLRNGMNLQCQPNGHVQFSSENEQLSEFWDVEHAFVPVSSRPSGMLLKAVWGKLDREPLHRATHDFVYAISQHYIHGCIEDARRSIDQLKSAYLERRDEHKGMYMSTMASVRRDTNFETYADVLAEVESSVRTRIQGGSGDPPSNEQRATDLFGVYTDARDIQPKYEAFMTTLAHKTGCLYTKGKRKNPFRSIEKIGFAPGFEQWGAVKLKDVIRGAQEMPDVGIGSQLLELLLACDPDEATGAKARGWSAASAGITEQISIVGVKNRWRKPTTGGWSDTLLTFTFVDDPAQHICEVQLVHHAMMRVRKQMGAHKGYGIFRCALELLEATGNDAIIAEIEGAIEDPTKTPGAASDATSTGSTTRQVGEGDCSALEARLTKAFDAKLSSALEALEQMGAMFNDINAKLAQKDAEISKLQSQLQRVVAEVAELQPASLP